MNEPFDTDEEPLLAKVIKAKQLAAEGTTPGPVAGDSDADDDELMHVCDVVYAKIDTFSAGSLPGASLPPDMSLENAASSGKRPPVLERSLLPPGAFQPFKKPRVSAHR